MSDSPMGNYTQAQLDLVRRQISLWETNGRMGEGFDDWLPEGVLEAPRGIRALAPDLPAVIDAWHRSFSDLHIEVVSLFGSRDAGWLAIEWTWQATRRSDGVTGVTPDAIIVQVHDHRIAHWREYFDTVDSVEFE